MATTAANVISNHEARDVLAHWRIEPLFVRPAGGTANAAVIVATRRGQFVLRRRNPRYSTEKQLLFDHEVLRHLKKKKLPVPHIVRTPNGSRWTNHLDHVYELFELIEGTEPDPPTDGQIENAALGLAKFHQAMHEFSPSVEKKLPRFFDPALSIERLQGARRHLTSDTPGNLGEIPPEKALATIDYLLTQAQLCLQRLSDQTFWSLPQVIVHGDWHPANLKFDGDKLVGIFDFDWLATQPRMIDVTDGLIFFGSVREEAIRGDDIWSLTQPFTLVWEKMKLFLNAYARNISIRPEEYAAIPQLMRQRCLYTRVDAMARKVPEDDQIRFLVTDVERPLGWITANEKRLSVAGWDR